MGAAAEGGAQGTVWREAERRKCRHGATPDGRARPEPH